MCSHIDIKRNPTRPSGPLPLFSFPKPQIILDILHADLNTKRSILITHIEQEEESSQKSIC